MKLILLSFAFLFYSTTYAQDINARINASKKIMKIYQEDCQIESEKIKETFELAATYIIHGEYNNMKEQMLKARSISKNADCQKSIDKFIN
jgi:hypothetical protein